ncbi:hypothetical protein H5410_045269 [Solanum commersonii]|uniref:Secreted protein n=1 Tax=Solanum commersonii TaxID=4109 RepID=A0A9J5X961_SOLCO|nr:hypothetical protein H5410_045269 [Solanum commersonii]
MYWRSRLTLLIKTPILGPVVIGSSWVQLERVNARPSPTHSARESEWDKAEAALKCCYSVFERNPVDSR